MSVKGFKKANRASCIFRINKKDLELVKAKLAIDGLSMQQLIDLLLRAYLKDNKEILKWIEKLKSQGKLKKGEDRKLDVLEKDEIYKLIEQHYSPLKYVEEAKKELQSEESK